jgi:hypothetical protein
MAYPKTMYNVNATIPPKVVNTEAEEKALGTDWKDTPQGAKYPKAKYHESLEPRLVNNEEEEKALSGWQDKPVEKKVQKDTDVMTQAYFKYLKSLGYTRIKTIEDAQKWVDALSQAERDKFYTDAKAYEAADKDVNEKLQNANLPKKAEPKPIAARPAPVQPAPPQPQPVTHVEDL